MLKKAFVAAAVVSSPLCLGLATLAAPKIFLILLGVFFFAPSPSLLLLAIGFSFAAGVLRLLSDPVANLITA